MEACEIMRVMAAFDSRWLWSSIVPTSTSDNLHIHAHLSYKATMTALFIYTYKTVGEVTAAVPYTTHINVGLQVASYCYVVTTILKQIYHYL